MFVCLSVCLYVCLSVCLFVRSITQERMIPKCSNLVYRMTLGYPGSGTVLEFKGQGHRVNKCIVWSSDSQPCYIHGPLLQLNFKSRAT